MKIDDILKMKPETLAATQYEALKKHAITILKEVISDLSKDNLDGVMAQLSFSGAGDDMGDDNSYITFGGILGHEEADMSDVLERLGELQLLMSDDH